MKNLETIFHFRWDPDYYPDYLFILQIAVKSLDVLDKNWRKGRWNFSTGPSAFNSLL